MRGLSPALANGAGAFTTTADGVWWMEIGLGVGLMALAVASTGARAARTAERAIVLFADPAGGGTPSPTRAARP